MTDSHDMFRFEKKMTDREVEALFIKTGELKSDGTSLFMKEGHAYRTMSVNAADYELRKLMTPETRMELSVRRLKAIVNLILEDPDVRIDSSIRNTGKIGFNNGVFDVPSCTLLPHDDKYRWATVDANYIENAKIEDAPYFFKFCRTSLEYDDHPEKTTVLLEYTGYSISDYTDAKQAMFLIGAPSSGKSKYLEFIQKLIGDSEVSQVNLSAIGAKFNSGLFCGKRLNVCTEVSASQFPPIEDFKRLVACDRSPAELKYKNATDFYPKLKFLSAGNSMPFPSSVDGTLSIIDRMTFLMFNHTIPREEWDTDLVAHLLEEKDVICSLAVKALKRLVDSNFEFTTPEDSACFAASYTDALNSLNLFLESRCTRDQDGAVATTKLWQAYREYCEANAFPIGQTIQSFVQRVEMTLRIKRCRVWVDGKQITVFKGLSLKDITAEESDEGV